jgi:hypothetical protein
LVCFEVNLTLVRRHTCWIYSGATNHNSVPMQDFMYCRNLIDGERHIYTADDKIVQVEAIEKFRLLIKTKFYLDFNETIFLLFFSRNEI